MIDWSVHIRHAVRSLAGIFAFGAGIAASLTLVGTRDLESYEHAFFSLDRGTAAAAVHTFGHPVYTLALGFGVRLPLHGSLGASPVAVLAPYLPAPVTYWLLIAMAITAAGLIVRHALEPMCGRPASWVALGLLFCSVPMVSYTVFNDWPETAVTYCAVVGCVFAPHALLALLASGRSPRARRLHVLSVAGAVWGLIGFSHPGAWPLLAMSLVPASILAWSRSKHPPAFRVITIIVLAAVALAAVGLQLPDIWRELAVAGDNVGPRDSQGPAGALIRSNQFPFVPLDDRAPFTFLLMAVVSLLIALGSPAAPHRGLTIGAALISIGLGAGATMLYPGSSPFAPSSSWALRDPAGAFAVLSAAGAAAASLHRGASVIGRGFAASVLALAGLQGPAYAAALILSPPSGNERASAWNLDMTAPGDRAATRGLPVSRMSHGQRLALWPGVRGAMREAGHASTDFADAGYPVLTAWTKQRTMQGLVEPNPFLFDQVTDLSSEILCDPDAVRFLQLRYLLMPPDVECSPWTRLPDAQVDGWLAMGVALDVDDRVRALPISNQSEPSLRKPALTTGAALLSDLIPLPGSSVTIEPTTVRINLADPAAAPDRALLVLPVAYDSAWQPSSGRVQAAGGLLAITGAREEAVTIAFRPDTALELRAISMTIAQALAIVGLLGLAYARPLMLPLDRPPGDRGPGGHERRSVAATRFDAPTAASPGRSSLRW